MTKIEKGKVSKYPPEYLFWKKRVEGQIRHTIHEHPEWFNLPTVEIRDKCIRSTAKRIIGEIVAGTTSGNSSSENARLSVAQTEKAHCVSRNAMSGIGSGIIAAAYPNKEERK